MKKITTAHTPISANSQQSAYDHGLMACEYCHSLIQTHTHHAATEANSTQKTAAYCPNCYAKIHPRKPKSLRRTWALLIAATALYLPANILPVMTVIFQGSGEPSTIMGGVFHLLDGGMWPLATIVFIASIFVPVMKLLILAGLTWSVQRRSTWNPKDRTRFYRFTEFVGRWSMVDIFVIAILVALVQFGNLASVYPGLGAISFAVVVILTMFAAHSFDPRLIWDHLPTTVPPSNHNND